MSIKEIIAARVAMELHDGELVNLGIGLPTMIPGFLPSGVNVVLQSELGIVGTGPRPDASNEDRLHVVDAGGQPASCIIGGAFIDSPTSFGLIRGGHVDTTVLGALQVDELGNLANWIIPGKMLPGMGGAMDLVVGAKRVIIAMEHTQKGAPKILRKCTLPLTAVACVDMIVTELGVFEFVHGRLLLQEIAEGRTLDEIRAATEADFDLGPSLRG